MRTYVYVIYVAICTAKNTYILIQNHTNGCTSAHNICIKIIFTQGRIEQIKITNSGTYKYVCVHASNY